MVCTSHAHMFEASIACARWQTAAIAGPAPTVSKVLPVQERTTSFCSRLDAPDAAEPPCGTNQASDLDRLDCLKTGPCRQRARSMRTDVPAPSRSAGAPQARPRPLQASAAAAAWELGSASQRRPRTGAWRPARRTRRRASHVALPALRNCLCWLHLSAAHRGPRHESVPTPGLCAGSLLQRAHAVPSAACACRGA